MPDILNVEITTRLRVWPVSSTCPDIPLLVPLAGAKLFGIFHQRDADAPFWDQLYNPFTSYGKAERQRQALLKEVLKQV